MKSRLIDTWIRIRASYWFIPSLMSLAALTTSDLAVRLDTYLGDAWLQNYSWLYANQPAGARALLSTVAGSMITVAGVTFSMTLLAVSHASSQIGPRLLTGFMRDRGNQFTLGTFIATFLYCLLVLRTVHETVDGQDQQVVSVFVPHFAVLVAVWLAMLSVLVLIYFFHHVPQTISVTNVISRVGDELLDSIDKLYPQPDSDAATTPEEPECLPDGFAADSQLLFVSGKDGYLRVLDTAGLLELATRHDIVIQLLQRPGNFATAGQPLLKIWPADAPSDELDAELRGMFSWGTERTREQDVMYPAEQLLEVLGKAMSPGVNGQYTALLCLNQFERAFAELLQRPSPSARQYDDENVLRVVACPVTRSEFITQVLQPVRQFIRDDWLTVSYLENMLERLMAMPALAESAPLLGTELATLKAEVAAGSMSAAEKKLLLNEE